jgi:hypothetical protein
MPSELPPLHQLPLLAFFMLESAAYVEVRAPRHSTQYTVHSAQYTVHSPCFVIHACVYLYMDVLVRVPRSRCPCCVFVRVVYMLVPSWAAITQSCSCGI